MGTKEEETTTQSQGTPSTGDHIEGSVISGNVSVQNGDFVARDQKKGDISYNQQGASPADIADAFASFYCQIEQKPDLKPQDKADVKADVQDVEEELKKGEDADETFIQRRLRSVKRMAPDIWEVILATFAKPAAGLGLVAEKIAEKMKAEGDES